MNSDVNLLRKVYIEPAANGYTLSAWLTRFGNLMVLLEGADGSVVYQGDNILEAREHARKLKAAA